MTSSSAEEWRDIPGFPGYRASSYGRLTGKRGQVLKGCVQGGMYMVVCIRVAGRSKTALIHRLVCLAFHGVGPDGTEVAHGDGNRYNNAPDNLRWATPSENHRDAMRHGTHSCLKNKGESHSEAKLTDDAIRAIRSAPQAYGMQTKLARKYGVTPGLVSMIRAGQRWRHVVAA